MAKRKEAAPPVAELCKIVPGLASLKTALDTIKPNPGNERAHDEKNIWLIETLLDRFGQDQPIVARAENRMIVKGHGRYAAMKKLGWTHAAVLFVDEGQLEAVARGVGDNRASETSQWDFAALRDTAIKLQGDGQDVHDLGWKPGELAFLLPDTKTQRPDPSTTSTALPTIPTLLAIKLTEEQRTVFDHALAKLAKMLGGKISEGRALELICADFMAGV